MICLGLILLVIQTTKTTLSVSILKQMTILESGEKITHDEATKQELISIYKTIWADIQNKDWDELNKMFALRDKEMDLAINDGENSTTVDDIKDDISIKNNKFWIPNNADFDNYSYINIFGNNKLVTLTQWTGKGYLGFNADIGNTMFNIVFAKINGKWTIVA